MYWLTGILGITLAVAPYVLGYADNTVALWTSLFLGGTVALVSLIEGRADKKGRWEYVAAAIAGVGAIAAPFILGFGNVTAAFWTSIVIGVLLAILASSKLYYDSGNAEFG